jgi:hypothetical protein
MEFQIWKKIKSKVWRQNNMGESFTYQNLYKKTINQMYRNFLIVALLVQGK